MVKLNFGIKGTPVKVEGETNSKETANVVKHGITTVGNIASTGIKSVQQAFVKVTDDIKETSDTRHQHKIEKEQIKMQKDQQEHEQKMEVKKFNEEKKSLFDKWSEHQLQKKELSIKEKKMEEEAKRQEIKDKEDSERKKKILSIIEVIVSIGALLILVLLYQKIGK